MQVESIQNLNTICIDCEQLIIKFYKFRLEVQSIDNHLNDVYQQIKIFNRKTCIKEVILLILEEPEEINIDVESRASCDLYSHTSPMKTEDINYVADKTYLNIYNIPDYECSICSSCYLTKEDLNKHLQTHSELFCPVSEKVIGLFFLLF